MLWKLAYTEIFITTESLTSQQVNNIKLRSPKLNFIAMWTFCPTNCIKAVKVSE